MRVLVSTLLLVGSLVPTIALAQDPAPTEGPVTHVYGRAPRPSVVVMLPRARVGFDRVERDHHAVDRIVESVEHAPF